MLKRNFEIGTNFYDTEALKAAIADFADVAEITYGDGMLTVTAEDDTEAEEIFNELMNHTLAVLCETA